MKGKIQLAFYAVHDHIEEPPIILEYFTGEFANIL